MSISDLLTLADSTASVATSPDGGSNPLGFGTTGDNQRQRPSPGEWSSSGRAANQEVCFGIGEPKKPRPSLTGCGIQGPLMRRSNGGVGEEIIDADGHIIAWTTNELLAVLIVELLNDYEDKV